VVGMKDFICTTPIAFIIFNRPEHTQRVFAEIRKSKPVKLLVIADGPRPNRVDDIENCAIVRNIIETIDWDCEVLKNYSSINLGCGKRPASGLDWVFSIVEEAIILEDDCLPHETFFPYCQELLQRYRDDKRIMSISGNNFQFGRRRTHDSYYLSRYTQTCGWATWQRAWKYYDFDMKLWPEVRNGQWLFDIFGSMQVVERNNRYQFEVIGGVNIAEYWHRMFDIAYYKKIDAWDFQFAFACFLQSGLHVLPNINLVANIGYGPEGTHTKNAGSSLANIPVEAMQFPLQHPQVFIRDAWADAFLQANNFYH
jgi:hypothetical protein